MMNEVLPLLVQELNAYFADPARFESVPQEIVVLPDGRDADPLSFKLGAVTAILINLEEEKVPRQAEPFLRRPLQGPQAAERVHPELRLSLYTLFVARFEHYTDSLLYLSRLIDYFRCHRVLDHKNTPTLPPSVEKLIPELITPSFSDQRNLWGSLRTSYLPSVLYKVKMATFEDPRGLPIRPVETIEIDVEATQAEKPLDIPPPT